MLILPIRKKWFDMIRSGEKKEEYREIKPYYTSRITSALGFPESERESIKELLHDTQTLKPIKVMFRNGYLPTSPSITADCYISAGTGKEAWGAETGKKYYIFKIANIA